ncbi:hypothetical protein [Nocardia sp. bgisy118]|uniref:hypothetical protein n=1 Tax=Nocardia sp. bgisy118 TaxID=3413786 RepID=UPI003F49DF0E
MPIATFTLSTHTNCTEHGAAYTLSATDAAPVHGLVFTDMAEHQVFGDGFAQRRPMVVFRFFGLTIDDQLMGNPRATVQFNPEWTGRTSPTRAISLGEPGYLTVHLGHPITTTTGTERELMVDLLAAITAEYLTDERVARHRHWLAELRRQDTARELGRIQALEQQAHRRNRDARAAVDAAWSLLQSVRKQY